MRQAQAGGRPLLTSPGAGAGAAAFGAPARGHVTSCQVRPPSNAEGEQPSGAFATPGGGAGTRTSAAKRAWQQRALPPRWGPGGDVPERATTTLEWRRSPTNRRAGWKPSAISLVSWRQERPPTLRWPSGGGRSWNVAAYWESGERGGCSSPAWMRSLVAQRA